MISQGAESAEGGFRMRGDFSGESSIGDRVDSTVIEFTRLPSAMLQLVAELQPPLVLLSASASIVV